MPDITVNECCNIRDYPLMIKVEDREVENTGAVNMPKFSMLIVVLFVFLLTSSVFAEWTNTTDTEIARIIGDVTSNPTSEIIVTIILGVLIAGFFILGVYDFRTKRDPVLLVMFPGAAACATMDHAADILGHLLLFEADINVFEIGGRPLPLWAFLSHVLAWTAVPYITYYLVRWGATVKGLMIGVGIGILGNIALEAPLTAAGTYEYWGTQPLDVFSPFPIFGTFPLVWAILNMTGGAVTGILIGAAPGLFSGWHVLRVAPVVAFCVLGWQWAVGWPFYAAVNHRGLSQSPDMMIATIGALATIALSLWFYWRIAQLAADSPVAEQARADRAGDGRVG